MVIISGVPIFRIFTVYGVTLNQHKYLDDLSISIIYSFSHSTGIGTLSRKATLPFPFFPPF